MLFDWEGNMNLLMNLSGPAPVELGSLKPGVMSLFVFADSADTAGDLLRTLTDDEQKCFFVIDDKDKKESEVSIVSIDGAQLLRRSSDRSVIKIPLPPDPLQWKPQPTTVRLSNVEDGMVIGLPRRQTSIYLKVKGNPSPAGKVIVVCLNDGSKVLIDDDLMVKVGTLSVHLNLCFKS